MHVGNPTNIEISPSPGQSDTVVKDGADKPPLSLLLSHAPRPVVQESRYTEDVGNYYHAVNNLGNDFFLQPQEGVVVPRGRSGRESLRERRSVNHEAGHREVERWAYQPHADSGDVFPSISVASGTRTSSDESFAVLERYRSLSLPKSMPKQAPGVQIDGRKRIRRRGNKPLVGGADHDNNSLSGASAAGLQTDMPKTMRKNPYPDVKETSSTAQPDELKECCRNMYPQYFVYTWVLCMVALASFLKLNYLVKTIVLVFMVTCYGVLILKFRNLFCMQDG